MVLSIRLLALTMMALLFTSMAGATSYYYTHGTSPSFPANVPSPPAITPLATPGATVETIGPGLFGVTGDAVQDGSTGVITGTDDTAAIQTAWSSHDLVVQSGNYAIYGQITIPTGKVMQCQAGATFYQVCGKCAAANTCVAGESAATISKCTAANSQFAMFRAGIGASNAGGNSISGCTFAGADVPAGANNYANARGGTFGYNWLMELTSGNGVHAQDINLQSNTFRDGQGDFLLLYSACGLGSASTSAACNSGTPGTEGPSNITIANNTFAHGVQPFIHVNGGQTINIQGNVGTDGQFQQEQDANVLQVIVAEYWFNDTLATALGVLDPIDGSIRGSLFSGNAKAITGTDGRGSWVVKSTVTGSCAATCTAGHTTGILDTCTNATFPNCPAHYWSNPVINGSTIAGQGGTQLNTPWCGGTTGLFQVCTSTNYVNVPLTAY